MSRQAGHNASHGSMAVNQIKVLRFHERAKLLVYLKICSFKWTADKIDLMSDNTGSVQAVVVISVGWSIIVSCIMNFIPHGLEQSDIIHFKLRHKAAYRSD